VLFPFSFILRADWIFLSIIHLICLVPDQETAVKHLHVSSKALEPEVIK
jgi:hypothetical protein